MSVQIVTRSLLRCVRAIVVSTAALMVSIGPTLAGDTTELDDAIARVHYAYYTNDLRSAQAAVTALNRVQIESNDAFLKDYQLGVAAWRLAELGKSVQSSDAKRSAGECERHVQAALKQDPRFVEAHVVHALCRLLRSDSRISLGFGARSCEQTEPLQLAKAINPRNPRLAWAEALCAYDANDMERASQHAQRALQLFDEPAALESHSDWGHAETCVLLGQIELRRGNRAAARDHIEQALVIAPDYVQAKTLLHQIAAAR